MRKLVLALLLATSFSGVFAQKIDDVKEKISKGKWDEAKEKIDKVMADPKNQTNSEALFYKAQIYHNLAKTHPEDTALSSGAFDAISNYLRLEEKLPDNKKFLLSTLEGNKTLFDIYSDYFKAGAENYNKKNYDVAFNDFSKAVETFNLLKKYNFTTTPFDTTSVLYAGVAAEQMKNKDLAVKYYSMLVDKKVPDTTLKSVYEYVVNYYLTKNDMANTRKYLDISEAVFPNYDRWLAYEMELVGDDKSQKIAKYRELLQKYPNNYDLALDYAVQYFNYTYSNETKPADYAQRQDTLAQALQKAMSLQQTPMVNYLMSRHINNQIADLEEQKRNVKGNAPADAAKRKDFDAKINQKYDELVTYSQKGADLYAQETSLKPVEKIYYKEMLGDLADYYQMKKNTAKATEYQNKIKQLQ